LLNRTTFLLAAVGETQTVIPEAPVPIAGVFDSGSWSLASLALAVLAFASFLYLCGALLMRYFQQSAGVADDADGGAGGGASGCADADADSGEGDPITQAFLSGGWLPWLLLSSVAAMTSIFLFAFSQDFSGVMVLFDTWGAVLAGLYLVQAGTLFMTLRNSSAVAARRTSAEPEASLIYQTSQAADQPRRLSLRDDELGRPPKGGT